MKTLENNLMEDKIGRLRKLALDELKQKADEIRKEVVEIAVKNGAGHIAPSLSCIELLTALYYQLMNIADSPVWDGRDRLVFSKAHGCYGLYAILADIGYLAKTEWINFYQGSCLTGCIDGSVENGIEAGCGALGHGLPMAVGIAFGAKLQQKTYCVYCIVGDGEMQEGSNWEAVQFAAKHALSNLTVIIDKNRLQAMDFLDNILTVKGRQNDLEKKMDAFGFEVRTCNGHNPEEIINTIAEWIAHKKQLALPQVLIADTIKGYGLHCMENIPKFHFRLPTDTELKMGNRYDS